MIALAIFLLYQQIENNVIQPAIIGKAVNLLPPTTMLAALIGGAAAGVPGALAATPLLGAAKALYFAFRDDSDEPADGDQPSPSPTSTLRRRDLSLSARPSDRSRSRWATTSAAVQPRLPSKGANHGLDVIADGDDRRLRPRRSLLAEADRGEQAVAEAHPSGRVLDLAALRYIRSDGFARAAIADAAIRAGVADAQEPEVADTLV